MRPSPEEQTRARAYDTMTERDDALESRFTYDREGWPSTLSFVSSEKVVLAREFLDLRLGRATQDFHADVRRWEDVRFGNELDPAPHGLIAFEIRFQMNPDARRFSSIRKLPSRAPAELPPMIPRNPTAKAMPPGHQTKREREEQLAQLRAQAEGLSDGEA